MIKVNYKSEVITKNQTITRKENISSVYFQNRGNTDVMVMDNVRIRPGENFIWENIPVSNTPVLIDSDIPVAFIPTETATNNQLLVVKIFYQIQQ